MKKAKSLCLTLNLQNNFLGWKRKLPSREHILISFQSLRESRPIGLLGKVKYYYFNAKNVIFISQNVIFY